MTSLHQDACDRAQVLVSCKGCDFCVTQSWTAHPRVDGVYSWSPDPLWITGLLSRGGRQGHLRPPPWSGLHGTPQPAPADLGTRAATALGPPHQKFSTLGRMLGAWPARPWLSPSVKGLNVILALPDDWRGGNRRPAGEKEKCGVGGGEGMGQTEFWQEPRGGTDYRSLTWKARVRGGEHRGRSWGPSVLLGAPHRRVPPGPWPSHLPVAWPSHECVGPGSA